MLYGGGVTRPPEFAVRFALCLWLGLAFAVAADEPVRVTKDSSFKQHLQWSPDGSRFLFTRIHEGKMAL
jgi:TolB protein